MDYTDPTHFQPAADVQAARRGTPATHPYVIGEWRLHTDGTVRLWAIQQSAAYWIDPAAGLSDRHRVWYRWRSRQAAHKWAVENEVPDLWNIINLDRLGVTSQPME